jgi:hypothetical protein
VNFFAMNAFTSSGLPTVKAIGGIKSVLDKPLDVS